MLYVEAPLEKMCSRCRLVLPAAAFGKSAARGLQAYCRKCVQDRDRIRRVPQREAFRLAREARLASPTKVCTICKVEKVKETDFYRHRNGDGFRQTCKECFIRQSVEYAQERRDPEAKRHSQWRANLAKFGISPEDHEAMNAAQGGLCAICRMPESRIHHKTQTVKRLAVDHCHKTGKVRGLLCSLCNTAIGQMREDPAIFAAAVQYLEQT